MRRFVTTALFFTALAVPSAWGADGASGEQLLPMPPERVWRAVHQALADRSAGRAEVLVLDDERFEVRLRPGAGAGADIRLDVDWDTHTGGTRLLWSTTESWAQAGAAAWVQGLVERAGRLRASNQLCRGSHPTPEEIEAAQIEIPASCEYSTGHFSTALFELEKCGDFDTALRIMADCVKRRHAGGLIRLSQYFDLGYGVPRRPERVVEFLRLGHHGAWLRPDGQRFRDAPGASPAVAVSRDDSGNDMSYGAFVDSDKRIKCLYGYAADKTGDHAAAVRIFEDCISRWNDPYSIIWLAHLLENGHGARKDLVRAAQLLRQGALHPDTSGYATLARYHYGMALLRGQGVPADPAQARHWLQRAAQEGLGEAREALAGLETGPDNLAHAR